jgi:phosphatidate phosphatase PAH1
MTYAFNGLDMSSAANDVIVVQHRDGTLHSSPFNVRFGKFKVLRPQDKVVSIEINDVMTKAVMKINSDGVAFWLEATNHVEGERPESPVQPLTSPVLSQRAASPGMADMPHIVLPKDPSSGGPSSPLKAAFHSTTTEPLPQRSKSSTDRPLPSLHVSSDATLDDINLSRDDELTSVLGRPAGEPHHQDPHAAPSVDAVASDDTSKLFEHDMSLFVSLEQREKYTELLRSINEGPSKDEEGRDSHGGITLSKLASFDEFSMGASEPTPVTQVLTGSVPAFGVGLPDTDVMMGSSGQPLTASFQEHDTASVASVEEEEYDEEDVEDGEDDDQEVVAGGGATPAQYYKPTITPKSVDLEKLGLIPGRNKVRYITHTSLQGRVVVESSIYLWSSDTKIVVSDIDGTVTKSDVWGHILPMIGKDWTHAGICSLYTKVAKNGYEFVYLTARSMSQQEQTRKFLWSIEQDGGMTLPRGPVLTAPDRFFTALTQEVSKRAHEFKIACLESIRRAFPRHSRPYYAGFGNRIGDVISYTATMIPKHKIFIIDTNSTLHVCRVKQTYRNLAHLVDVSFPPLKPTSALLTRSSVNNTAVDAASVGRRSASPQGYSGPSSTLSSPTLPATQPAPGAGVAVGNSMLGTTSHARQENNGMQEGETVDADFNSFNFWRVPMDDVVPLAPMKTASTLKKPTLLPPAAAPSASGSNCGQHPMYVDTTSRSFGTPAQALDATGTQGTGSGKSWLRWFGGSGAAPALTGSATGGPTSPSTTSLQSQQNTTPLPPDVVNK